MSARPFLSGPGAEVVEVVVTSFADGKKIQAIKGIRAAAGIGLKEAKDVTESLGTERAVLRVRKYYLPTLDQHGVTYVYGNHLRRNVPKISMDDFIGLLAQYPPGITVGELQNLLQAIKGTVTLPKEDSE